MLFPSPIFGPVHSRRLGVSLGINLLPGARKVCSFNCIYCECGLNPEGAAAAGEAKLPTRREVAEGLERKLAAMAAEGTAPDVLTFAGNGEPTLHPEFASIIDDTIALRDRFFPRAQITVLSNATQVMRQPVFDALCRVDNNCLKLDTVSPDYIRLVDQPQSRSYSVERTVARLAEFGNRCIIQTMFLRGTAAASYATNTTEEYVQPWLLALQQIQPREVQIYTIDRPTPTLGLEKAAPAVLDAIAARVREIGLQCTVSY